MNAKLKKFLNWFIVDIDVHRAMIIIGMLCLISIKLACERIATALEKIEAKITVIQK